MVACVFIPSTQGAKREGLGVEATPGYIMKFCPPKSKQNQKPCSKLYGKNHTASVA